MAVPLEVHEPLCLSIKVSKTFLKTRSPAFRCPKIAWVAGLGDAVVIAREEDGHVVARKVGDRARLHAALQ